MTTTTIPTANRSTFNTSMTTTPTQSTARTGLWKTGAVVGVVAAVATTLVVVAARAAGVAVAVEGEPIPLVGFAQFTLVGTLIGVVLAKVLADRARLPRRTFVTTTVVLTALSIVPDAIIDASTASKIVLMLTHVVAAMIVVPALASRLHR